MEFMDSFAMKASRLYSNIDYPEAATLFFEFHGLSANDVQMQINLTKEVATSNGSTDFKWSSDMEKRNKLWKARHESYYAIMSQIPGGKGLSTDVCVPISRLSDMVEFTNQEIQKVEDGKFLGVTVGHAGDGNFHTSIHYGLDSDEPSVWILHDRCTK